MAEAPVLGSGSAGQARPDDRLRRRASTCRSSTESVRRRAGRSPAGHGRRRRPAAWSPAAAPSPGARRAPAEPAPAPAARRSGPAAAPSFGPQPRSYTFKVNRKEQPRSAAQRALRSTPSAARSRCLTRSAWTDAFDQAQAAGEIEGMGRVPDRSWCSSRRRSPRRRSPSATSPECTRPDRREWPEWQTCWVPASLLVSEPALELLTARAVKPRSRGEAEA